MADPIHLILARHGQSEANTANVFTGWSNPPLTEVGRREAESIVARLMKAELSPASVFSSSLDRALETSRIVVAGLGLPADVAVASAALNERDYGELTGMNKGQAVARWGDRQILDWRRSYTATPPNGESLRDTASRVLSYYLRVVVPALLDTRCVLIVAHGNSLRALVQALEGLRGDEVETLEIRTGETWLYTMANDTRIISRQRLGD